MTVRMNLGENSYDIIVERSSLASADKYLNLNRNVLIVTDDGVPPIYSQTIAKLSKNPILITLKQGEDTKSFESLF